MLACCGVTAEAVWNRRPWRLHASSAMVLAGLLMAVARFADRALPGTIGKPGLIVPEQLAELVGVSILFLFVYLRPHRFRRRNQLRVPRP
ncbi:MAG TPA: hypothetical protein VFS20_10365 [Longimicrobium sp.]|nr:hypothetical protein [Longimicrobium sp.]